jgi:transketolase
MSALAIDEQLLALLEEKATRLRIDSIRATTAAGSGHPTSCASAAEIMSVLFFSVMRYDPVNPRMPGSDRFVLSKGHAAPILYAAWAEAGAFPVEHLTTLRRIDSDLEGHPTPRLPFVDVATGSLGQGLAAGLGMAIGARLDRTGQRVYVLLGDGESAEGSVWESAEIGSAWRLGNLCATIDINRLGQSQPTLLQHDMETHRRRWESFGWQALIVDGHSIPELLAAYGRADQTTDRPTVVLARTIKGKGMLDVEGKEGEHGKAMPPEFAARIIAALQQHLPKTGRAWTPSLPVPTAHTDGYTPNAQPAVPAYKAEGKEVATRKAFGEALAALGKIDPRIVVLDGDVRNSTYTEEFLKVCPDRFFECFIAEQNMVGTAVGLAAHGKIPFASTFGCFFTRAYDFRCHRRREHQAGGHSCGRFYRRGRTISNGVGRHRHDVRRAKLYGALSVRCNRSLASYRTRNRARRALLSAIGAPSNSDLLWPARDVRDRQVQSYAAKRPRSRADRGWGRDALRSFEGVRPVTCRRPGSPRHRLIQHPTDRPQSPDSGEPGCRGISHHGGRSLRSWRPG